MLVFQPIDRLNCDESLMARWPRHVWTSLLTYGIIFLLFPALCLLAYAWVQQWIF
mgnify:CR=1 FL=1